MDPSKKYLESQKYILDHYTQLGDVKKDFRNYNLVKLIASKVKGTDVLDIGCGNGFLLSILAKKGLNTFGLEPNKEMIKLAKKVNPGLNILHGYAEDVEKINHKMDTITIIDVLEHIEDDEAQLKKIYNVLKEGGRLIIVVPAFQLLYGKRDKSLGHYRRYSKKGLDRKLLKSGFRITSARHWNMAGFLPYLLYERVFKKELNTSLRFETKISHVKKMFAYMLNFWFRHVENKINFWFGLSLICIAEKPKDVRGG